MVGRDRQKPDSALGCARRDRARDIVRARGTAFPVKGRFGAQFGALGARREAIRRFDKRRWANGVVLGRYGRHGRVRPWRLLGHVDGVAVGADSGGINGNGRPADGVSSRQLNDGRTADIKCCPGAGSLTLSVSRAEAQEAARLRWRPSSRAHSRLAGGSRRIGRSRGEAMPRQVSDDAAEAVDGTLAAGEGEGDKLIEVGERSDDELGKGKSPGLGRGSGLRVPARHGQGEETKKRRYLQVADEDLCAERDCEARTTSRLKSGWIGSSGCQPGRSEAVHSPGRNGGAAGWPAITTPGCGGTLFIRWLRACQGARAPFHQPAHLHLARLVGDRRLRDGRPAAVRCWRPWCDPARAACASAESDGAVMESCRYVGMYECTASPTLAAGEQGTKSIPLRFESWALSIAAVHPRVSYGLL